MDAPTDCNVTAPTPTPTMHLATTLGSADVAVVRLAIAFDGFVVRARGKVAEGKISDSWGAKVHEGAGQGL